MSTETQSQIMRLEQENKRLKSLLNAAGLPQIWIDAYLKLEIGSDAPQRPPFQRNSASDMPISAEASAASSASSHPEQSSFDSNFIGR